MTVGVPKIKGNSILHAATKLAGHVPSCRFWPNVEIRHTEDGHWGKRIWTHACMHYGKDDQESPRVLLWGTLGVVPKSIHLLSAS